MITVRKLAYRFALNNDEVEEFIRSAGFKTHVQSGETFVDDKDVNDIVSKYKTWSEEQKAIKEREEAELEALQAEEAVRMREAFSKMLITSGFSFDGYRIVKYSGYISGDDAIQVNRGTVGVISDATDVGSALMSSLAKIRRNALYELKEAAYNLGCNAVIGVDFDYITLEPETANFGGGTTYLPYVFGVTANGNAVVIEKDDSK